MNIEKFKGVKVKAVYADEDNLSIALDNGKTVNFEVEGDCCSNSYFYEVVGAEKLIGKEITSIEEIDGLCGDVPNDQRFEGEDCVQAYGIRFSAGPSMTEIKPGVEVETSNSMIVTFRNDSNGYYGGSMRQGEYVPTHRGIRVDSGWKLIMKS